MFIHVNVVFIVINLMPNVAILNCNVHILYQNFTIVDIL